MKPYMVIEGSNRMIEDFEKKVADALEMGYCLAGELVTQSTAPNEIKFYQTVLISDDAEDDDEDEDFDDEEEDDED